MFDEMLENRHLELVPVNLLGAKRVIGFSTTHLETAAEIVEQDPAAALIIAYDACRKAGSAVLLARGIRPTSRGGHVAVRDAIQVLVDAGDLELDWRGFDRLRRRRNESEYESDDAAPVTAEEARRALKDARSMVKELAKSIKK